MSHQYPYRFVDYREPAKLTIEADGIATGRARIARAGVMIYYLNGRRVRVLRHPDIVQKTAFLFVDRPITLDHPLPEDGGEVNASNKDRLVKGWGSFTEYLLGWLETPVRIFAQDAIDAAQKTHRYFSNGYNAILMDGDREWDRVSEPKGGIWIDVDGLVSAPGTEHPYDVEQIPISGNHIALVENPRAGEGATFIDSDGEIIEIATDVPFTPDKRMKMPPAIADMIKFIPDMAKSCGYEEMEELDMSEFEMDGKYSVPKSMKDMMGRYDKMKAEKMKSEMSDSADFVDTATYKAAIDETTSVRAELAEKNQAIGRLKTENARLSLQLKDANDPKKIEALHAERSESFNKAKPFLDHTAVFDPLKDASHWKKEALAAAKINHDGYSDDQIDVAFDTLAAVTPSFRQLDGIGSLGSIPVNTADFDQRVATARRSDVAIIDSDRVLPQNRPVSR